MARAMKLVLLLVALLSLWLPGSFGQEDAPANGEEAAAPEINEEKVVVLTKDNFDSVTKENKNTLVSSRVRRSVQIPYTPLQCAKRCRCL